MTDLMHQPHDLLFKKSMADIRVATEFLQTYLSKKILAHLDLSTLALKNNQLTPFLKGTIKRREADVIYACKTHDGGSAYIYLLCEHQSEADKYMAFRLLTYQAGIMQAHLDANGGRGELPVVYPLVLYSGRKPWRGPQRLFDLFGKQHALARDVLFAPFQLIDVHRMPDETLKSHTWSGVFQYALKHRKAKNFAHIIKTILPWVQQIELQGGVDFARAVLYYLVEGMRTNKQQLTRLLIEQAEQHLSKALGGEIMTLAQQFEALGRQEGRREGRQEGRQEAQGDMVKKLLSNGVSLKVIQDTTGWPVETIRSLMDEIKV